MEPKMLNTYLEGVDRFEVPRFAQPDHCLYPVYFWIWNTKITKDGIRQQIDDMLAAEIRGFSIIAEPADFRPDSMVTALDPPYLSDEFMELVQYAVEYAASRQMIVWIYDEGGWPSGGAGGLVVKQNRALSRKVLARRTVCLEADQIYTASEDTLASFIGANRIQNGFVSTGVTQITEYFRDEVSTFFSDITEAENGSVFFHVTHDRYKDYVGQYFGDVIPLVFTDEPTASFPAFCSEFSKQFRDRFGYDILDHLPVIFEAPDVPSQPRADYLRLCGELVKERFLQTMKDWCDRNGLLAAGHHGGDHDPRYDTIVGRTAIVDALTPLHIPGIDAIWRQIMPEGKARDTGAPFFPRVAPTAAHICGRNLALSESFAVYGAGLNYRQMRYTLNYQLVRGINLHSLMLIPYGRERFFTYTERPNFIPENPGYSHIAVLNRYVARASYLQAIGTPDVDTALYLPSRDVCAGGSIADKAYEAYRQLGISLEEDGINFDILDDFCLEHAEFFPDKLRVGNAEYRHIYIPENQCMDPGLLVKLLPLLSGGKAVCRSSTGFAKLRVSKRRLNDGETIWFFFNEDDIMLQTDITLPSGGILLYELNMLDGTIREVRAAEDGGFSLELISGESKAYLVTNSPYVAALPCANSRLTRQIPIDTFRIRKVSETILDAAGIHRITVTEAPHTASLSAWAEAYGKAFSGEVLYQATVTLDAIPDGAAFLDLGTVEHSVSVSVNGEDIGTAIFDPYILPISAGILKAGENEIEILVANTAGNQYALSGADQFFEEKETGCYHHQAKEMELESPDGGLYGPVVLKL